jgi:hypothetical protein
MSHSNALGTNKHKPVPLNDFVANFENNPLQLIFNGMVKIILFSLVGSGSLSASGMS